MFETTGVLDSSTGARLAWYHMPAKMPARGLLLISHGLAEHASRYAPFAAAMAGAGFHVYAHDHRGHGRTTAPDSPIGQFAGKDGTLKVLADLLTVRAFATERHPGLPVVLLGHSMGGLIALNYAEAYPDTIDALAVWNANFNGGLAGRTAQMLLSVEKMLKGSDVPSALLPKLTFETWGKAVKNHRTLFDWLSHDDAEVAAYIADPLCGFDASVSMWSDVFGMVFSGARADRLTRLPPALPVLLVGGGQDPSTDKGRAMLWLGERMRAVGLAQVNVRIYETMRHETLKEIGRERTIDDFIAWCCDATRSRDERLSGSFGT